MYHSPTMSAHECIATAFEYVDSSTPTRGDALLAPMSRNFASGFIFGHCESHPSVNLHPPQSGYLSEQESHFSLLNHVV